MASPSIQNFSDFNFSDTVTVAFENPFTPGDAIVVCGGANSEVDSVVDDGGNSYTLAAQVQNGIGIWVAIYYSLTGNDPGNITVGSSGGSFVNALIVEYPPCTAARDAQGGQFNVSPLELDLDMVTGDIVIGYAKALNTANVDGGEVDGDPATLFDSGLADLAGFDDTAPNTGSLTVRALMTDESGVFGALVALSLITGTPPTPPDFNPMFFGSGSVG